MGVAVAVVALAAVLWYMILLRERRRRSAVVGPEIQDSKTKECQSKDDTFVYNRPELGAATPVHGRGHQTRLEEMPADLGPQELQA